MIDTKKLDQVIKSLKQTGSVKVGILGDSRNATIGACHEFGTSKMAQRSFLRMPLSEKLNGKLQLTDSMIDKMRDANSVAPWLEEIGITAVGVVLEAFDTGGYGQWAAWKNKNYENNTGMILVDTTQLRDSVTYEVNATGS